MEYKELVRAITLGVFKGVMRCTIAWLLLAFISVILYVAIQKWYGG
jgi:hypothetical protein